MPMAEWRDTRDPHTGPLPPKHPDMPCWVAPRYRHNQERGRYPVSCRAGQQDDRYTDHRVHHPGAVREPRPLGRCQETFGWWIQPVTRLHPHDGCAGGTGRARPWSGPALTSMHTRRAVFRLAREPPFPVVDRLSGAGRGNGLPTEKGMNGGSTIGNGAPTQKEKRDRGSDESPNWPFAPTPPPPRRSARLSSRRVGRPPSRPRGSGSVGRPVPPAPAARPGGRP